MYLHGMSLTVKNLKVQSQNSLAIFPRMYAFFYIVSSPPFLYSLLSLQAVFIHSMFFTSSFPNFLTQFLYLPSKIHGHVRGEKPSLTPHSGSSATPRVHPCQRIDSELLQLLPYPPASTMTARLPRLQVRSC